MYQGFHQCLALTVQIQSSLRPSNQVGITKPQQSRNDVCTCNIVWNGQNLGRRKKAKGTSRTDMMRNNWISIKLAVAQHHDRVTRLCLCRLKQATCWKVLQLVIIYCVLSCFHAAVKKNRIYRVRKEKELTMQKCCCSAHPE